MARSQSVRPIVISLSVKAAAIQARLNDWRALPASAHASSRTLPSAFSSVIGYRAAAMISAEGYRAPRDPLIGQVVHGRYQIMHAIGKGSMGVVYEAQHLLIGRKVALKAMSAHAVSPAGVQRFRREAQAAAAVGNSHVVDVLDMGQLENGSFYIVMEHLDGADLCFAVALEERFSVGRAMLVLGQLCDALSAIHAAGIIHRDLKPENIFLTTRDGVPDFVKVLDFGVCKFNDADGARLTATGDAVGTPLFMAPEQVEGRTDIDHRVDVYALGAILYFALTGRPPFDAPNLPALFLRICHEPTPSLCSTNSHLSLELDAIVQRALSKDRNARFGSCAELKAALRSLQTTPDEVAATLPGVLTDSRVSDYVWGNIGGNSTISLAPAAASRRRRWLGVGALSAGALALSASLVSHFVRGRSLEASRLTVAAPVLPTVPEPVRANQPIAVAESIVAADPLVREAKDKAPVAAGPQRQQSVTVTPQPIVLPTLSTAVPESSPVAPSPPAPSSATPGPADSASGSAPDLHFTRTLKRGL